MYQQPSGGSGQGHGPFSEEDVQQIMAETGYPYEQVCQDIDKTGAQTKEELYPQLYTGQGIMPPQEGGETVGSGMVQGGPAPNDRRAQAQAAMQEGAPPTEGGAPPAPGAIPGEGGPPQGIPPEVAAAAHEAMAPPPAQKRRVVDEPETGGPGEAEEERGEQPAWMAARKTGRPY